jgi:hypothetical protein
MKCEEYRLLIEDYFDGALDESTAARVNAHTHECAQCGSFCQEMSREQELYARYQRDVEATPVLWASIESQINQERAGKTRGLIWRLREQWSGMFSAPRLSPAFAAVLVIVTIGVTVLVMSRLNSPQQQLVATDNGKAKTSESPSAHNPENATVEPKVPVETPHNEVASSETATARSSAKIAAPRKQLQVRATVTPAQLVRDAEQKYLAAIAMLSRDVNRRRSQLDPMMLARFDASLSEIDRTIRETRQVVRQNPEDPIALQYLLAAYSKKVDVLRGMTSE